MIERCPACGAKDPGNDVCRRCRAELHWLTRIQAAAQYEAWQAVRCVQYKNLAAARRCVQRAVELKNDGFAQVLAGFLTWQTVRGLPDDS